MPVINVPAFRGIDGMPVGVSVATGRLFDQNLLKIVKFLSEPLMAEGGWEIEKSDSSFGTMTLDLDSNCKVSL